MITVVEIGDQKFKIDLSQPLDISIPLRAGEKNVNAWYTEPLQIEPVSMEGFIGDVQQGGSVNFRNIKFNPHGNGTHTECVGHISRENYSINQCLKQFFFLAELISIEPKKMNGDQVITADQIKQAVTDKAANALVIRTLPNPKEKLQRQYSGTNPPYMEAAGIRWVVAQGIDHLLIDLPSVDREEDDGLLAAHKAFWDYPENPKIQRTITEMIYVPDQIPDGIYLLNLQIAPFENDASPSKPVLYRIITEV